jgi:hypothetical protein
MLRRQLSRMNIERIRKLRNAKPFRPFELVVADGAVVRIDRPLAIALAPNGRSVAGYDPVGKSFYFSLAELSDLRLVRARRVNRNGRR